MSLDSFIEESLDELLTKNPASIEELRALLKSAIIRVIRRAFKDTGIAASILGKAGGEKGGKARMAKLSPERRREIAIAAANKRWHP